jgi:hypothetical protein
MPFLRPYPVEVQVTSGRVVILPELAAGATIASYEPTLQELLD